MENILAWGGELLHSSRKKLITFFILVLIGCAVWIIPIVKYRIWAIIPNMISNYMKEQKDNAEIQQHFSYLGEEIKELDDRINTVFFRQTRPASLGIIITYKEESVKATPMNEIQEIIHREKENINRYFTERENYLGTIGSVFVCIDVDADYRYDHVFDYDYDKQKWSTDAP